jgi:hypothetical protein
MESKLPTELFTQIDNEAIEHEKSNRSISPYISYRKGALSYAQWKVKYDELVTENEKLKTVNRNLEARDESKLRAYNSLSDDYQQLKERCEKMEGILRLCLEYACDPDNDSDPGITLWNIHNLCKEQLPAKPLKEGESNTPAPVQGEKPRYYTDDELRIIISMVCDQLNEGFNGREEFIDQTISVFAAEKAKIEELRKQGVKHPNPHLCDNRTKCGYPGCECLPF